MRLFNFNLHISVIADVKGIFARLFPDVEITDWSISGHTWVMGKERAQVDFINQNTWKGLNKKMIADFHRRYDTLLRQFDGFIVTYPCSFALLFERYNKPIFMVNAIRYEIPFCWNHDLEMMAFMEERLQAMHQSGQLIAVSNNLGDWDYLKMGTGIDSAYIPSLCLYTGTRYQPRKNDFVVFSKSGFPKTKNLVPSKSLGRFTWEDLYCHRGIVHMPYETTTI